ncbi:violaxanthin de-epoxidase, chloroplastic [Tanacetum coccineum]
MPFLDSDDSSSSNLLSCSTDDDNDDVRIVAVVGEGAVSPLKSASWTNVLLHIADRLKWVDENYEMLVFTDNVLESNAALQKELTSANILLIVSVLNCLLDPNCRKALQCLNECSPVDQVCNYQCLASYESPTLEEFSLCVLQKHNCLDLDAKIPEKPFVPPMVKFQEKILSHEIAEDLFVGWLGNLDWRWRVVAGQNPAYNQFPCQYQLFYRGKAKGSFWYEPVFQVKTLDGKFVWRRRKYRVKRRKVTGTFYFSVLDNGVVSNEYWTTVDVSEDFSWGLFHYSGAARVAGQSYTGAVLVSPNGEYPNETEKKRLVSALDR